MIQRYDWSEFGYVECSYGDLCKQEDVAKLEAKYAKLEAKYAKLGEYCCQLYYAAANLTNPYIEREQEELKEQVKDTLRNFEKDPLFLDVFA